MDEPVHDYAEEDAETVVLSRWDKIKKWIEIAMATKKLATLVWALVFGVGGTMAVGKITDTTPLRDAAIELGIVETSTSTVVSDETVPEHTHPEIPHTHPLEAHTHTAVSEHIHPPQAIPVVSQAAIAAEIEKLLPPNHLSLH